MNNPEKIHSFKSMRKECQILIPFNAMKTTCSPVWVDLPNMLNPAFEFKLIQLAKVRTVLYLKLTHPSSFNIS